MIKILFICFARLLGVYLVTFSYPALWRKQLAVALNHPKKCKVQNVVVLFPHRYNDLTNPPFKPHTETYVIGSRDFRWELYLYLEAISRAAKKLKECQKKH